MVRPEPTGIGKITGFVVRPLFGVVRQQLGRRAAESHEAASPSSVDKELNEALGVLRRSDNTLAGEAWAWIKSLLSDPPAILREPEAQDWLAREDVQTLLRQATLALVAGQDLAPFEAEARRLFGVSADEAEWYGAPLFEYAVAFLALTLRTKVDTGTRLQLAVDEVRDASFKENLHVIRQESVQTRQLVEALAGAKEPPVDVIDRYLEAEVARRESLRSVVTSNTASEVGKLADRVFSGNLAAASASVRVMAYRFVAATCARDGDPDTADLWLARAADVGANDLASDRARIALARGAFGAALELLNGHSDRVSNSLRLDALERRDGRAAAIEYFETYCSPDQVSGFFLATLADWYLSERGAAAGEALLSNATAEQIEENRTLRFLRLRYRLALCAAPERQVELVNSHATFPAPSSLRDDAEGLRLRALALGDARLLLAEIGGQADENFVGLVELTEQYLALISGDTAVVTAAHSRLRERLADPKTRIIYATLSTPFGLDFDRHALAAQLDQAARLTGWDDMQLRAAFDLAVQARDPQRLSDLVDQYRARLIRVVGPRQAIGIQVEMLARNGRVADARAKLAQAAELLEEQDARFLADIIAEVAGEATPDLHLARFQQTDSEEDLLLCVDALQQARDARLPDFAHRLWQRRRRIDDAVTVADAFSWFGRDIELRDFLAGLGESVSLSPALTLHLAWIYYREGRLDDARELAQDLQVGDVGQPMLRQLRINLAIESGEWFSLGALYKEDLKQVERRSARQLLQSAALASTTGNPDGKLLLQAAADKAGNDAQIYVNAFDIAVRRGEDLDDTSVGWLNRAAELSGDDGPLRPGELRDLVAARDEGIERATQLDRMILTSEVTVAMAAKPLGTTLASIILERAAQNPNHPDARRRTYLPLYSGNRLSPALGDAKRIAIEPTALLVLQMLGLLDSVFGAFETIVLPSGTLPALFDDLIRGDRGQPSRTARAEEVLRLVRSQRLAVIPVDVSIDDSVERQFALAEAENGRQVVVPPLRIPGSLDREVRDPTPFMSRLASVAGLVAALADRGEIGDPDIARANRFPAVRKLWDDEASIDLTGPLILDATSLHFIIDAGLVAPLLRLNVRLVVDSEVIAYAEAEIQEREAIDALKGEIEKLRATLSSAVRTGKAIIGPAMRNQASQGNEEEDEDDDESQIAPLTAILRDSAAIDWLIADDRVVNQHGIFIDSFGRSNGVATTLDLLNHLRQREHIDAQQYGAVVQRLRSSGLGLVPVDIEEILTAAALGDWQHGPSRSLRAMRDAILLPMVRKSILLPLERYWIEQTMLALALAAKRVFRTMPSDRAALAAEFLFGILPDLRALVADFESPELTLWGDTISVGVLALLASPLEVDEGQLEAYHAWFAGSPLEQLQGRDAGLWNDLVSRLKNVILTHRDQLTVPEDVEAPPPEVVARWLLAHVPPVLRLPLVQDSDIRAATGHSRVLTLGETRVEQTALIAFLSDILHGRETSLLDIDGTVIVDEGIVNEDGSVSIVRDDRRLRFEHAGLYGPDPAAREATLADLLATHTFSPSRERYWLDRVREDVLRAEDFHALAYESRHTAEQFVETMVDAMADEAFEIQALAQVPEIHFSSLCEPAGRDVPLDDWIEGLATARQSGLHPQVAAIASAPLAITPSFSLEAFTGPLEDGDAAALASHLVKQGDPFSLLAVFDLLCRHVDNPACRELGDQLLEDVWGSSGSIGDLAEDFCTAAILTMTVTRWEGPLRAWSLPQRRLATLAHAGLVCRVFRNFEIHHPGLYEQVRRWFGPQFTLSGSIDRGEARDWSPSWLIPDAIEAYLLLRFDQALDAIAEEKRPENWVEHLRNRAAGLVEERTPFLFMPSPLDQFSHAGRSRPVMSTEDFESLVSHLREPVSLGTADLVLRVAMTFAPPANTDLSGLVSAIVVQASTAEGNLRTQYHQIALELAIGWTLPELAEGVAGLLPADELVAPALIEHALSVANSYADPVRRDEVIRQRLTQHAHSIAAGTRAQAFTRALQVTINGEPRFASMLHEARLVAALAM